MTYEQATITRDSLISLGLPIPPEISQIIADYEKDIESSATPIYDTLKRHSKFPVTKEKEECVVGTVNDLLSDEQDAANPGLLLGKIQCGKTDTFENIIGLSFDRGIDICVVLTKGTKALVDQTIKRMRYDYRFFKESDTNGTPTIFVEDIMENRNGEGFNRYRMDNGNLVIVAKKEATNLRHLINVFSQTKPWLKDKKVLIVDDEADFASRNYKSAKDVKQNQSGKKSMTNALKLAIISELIDEFRKIPKYCRYLQVTATPYCLFLQPDGNINIQGGIALPFKPRFTRLVPVHSKYIGGQQYFKDSEDSHSMYSHLFHPVSSKCVHVLGHEDRRYLTSGIASGNISGLTYALVGYLMASAIRRIQNKSKGKRYKSSAILHANVDKDNHDWQNRLIRFMIGQLREYFSGISPNIQLDFIADRIFSDYSESNQKAVDCGLISVAMPSLMEIKEEIKEIFEEDAVNIKTVNSDNDINALLDRESGQLRLDAAVNIFIGGSILDRGITINNMLCFFYGRSPKKFQQDTVLQHARFYGARDLEDMAVTRLHTTNEIYSILKRMNELDEQLRQWFLDGFGNTSNIVPCIGYDKNINPCAPSKIKPSKIVTISEQKRFLPIGMNTKKKSEISKTTHEIYKLITTSPKYKEQDEDGFFEMDNQLALKILKLIESTYSYDEESKSHNGDMREVESVLCHSARFADNKVWAIHRTNRNMSRIRENGCWIDAPDDGRTDTAPAKKKATDRPVLMLIRQNGDKLIKQIGLKPNGIPENKNFGWNGAEFYWPVVITQANLEKVFFAANQKNEERQELEIDNVDNEYDPEETLNITYKGNLLDWGNVGDTFSLEDDVFETRGIKDTTAAKYLWKDNLGFVTYVSCRPNSKNWAGVYTYNNGKFPFIVRGFKYLILRAGATDNQSRMVFELYPREYWPIVPVQQFDENGFLIDYLDGQKLIVATDTVTNTLGDKTDIANKNVCQWVIKFRIKKILAYTPAPKVKD